MSATPALDAPHRAAAPGPPTPWLRVSLLLTAAYVVFALILIGVPGLARGGVVAVALSLAWLLYGIARGHAAFPRVLWMPVAFFVFALLSGALAMSTASLASYPSEYMGQMATVWVGGIVIAAFVANGVPMSVVIGGFVAVFAANLVAIAVGYDGFQINIEEQSMESLRRVEIERVSGLAGQANLLIALTFTLPFLLFLMRRRTGFAVYAAMLAACVAMTILTGSRSGIALTLLFAVSGGAFLIRSTSGRAVAAAIGIGAGIFTYAYLDDPLALSRIEANEVLGELVVVKRLLAGLDGDDESARVREEMAGGFWPNFYARPILGYGPDAFKDVSGTGMYAHNNFAEIAVNWGLVGLLLYHAMYVRALLGIAGSPRSTLPAVATLAFLIVVGHWFVTYLERPLVLCLCLLLVVTAGTGAAGRRDGSRRRRRRRPRKRRSNGAR